MGLPLFTADYSTQLESNDGNRILLERGAIALRQSRSTGRANLARLFELAQRREAEETGGGVGQQDLFPR